MGTLDFASVIPNHRQKTAILDTNLLILWVTAQVDLQMLNNFKRVKSLFTVEDAILLDWVVSQFRAVLTTAYVLTEASNLGGSLAGLQRDRWFAELAGYAARINERHVPTKILGESSETVRFGLADSALSHLSSDSVIITAEYRLSGYLQQKNAPVLNFNHLRPLWMLR